MTKFTIAGQCGLVAADWWRKEHRSYFLWEFGKPSELALAIVFKASSPSPVVAQDKLKTPACASWNAPWTCVTSPGSNWSAMLRHCWSFLL
jgi:hypothetical protein